MWLDYQSVANPMQLLTYFSEQLLQKCNLICELTNQTDIIVAQY